MQKEASIKQSTSTTPHVIVVIGPTASGKSDFAVRLAHTCNGEIISVDSRQIFKDLDIGTGKITQKEMEGIPHHMLSVYDLHEEVSVARFKYDALPILNDIIARNKTPILCGGTGQYLDALIYTNEPPAIPPNKKLREQLEKKTTEELYEEILKKDSRRAKTIDQYNRVRLIRALEILEELPSVPLQEAVSTRYPTSIFLITRTRTELRERITKRLKNRIEEGIVEEVEKVRAHGYHDEQMKKFGLEYYLIDQYLSGNITKEKMEELIIRDSMRYAKRQETWNKKYVDAIKV